MSKNRNKKKGMMVLVSQKNPFSSVSKPPVAISVGYDGSEPRSLPSRRGGVRFEHTEFVGDFEGGADFSLDGFEVNPGLSDLFPWLSYIAMIYESYMFHRLRFHLVPLRPTSEPGQNFMFFDPDAADSSPASKFELLNNRIVAARAAYKPIDLDIANRYQETLGRKRYIRSGSLASNLDIKTYDVGVIYAGSQGLSDTVDAFSLFVSYDVELIAPTFSLSTIASAWSRNVFATTGVSKTAIWGTDPTYLGGANVTADTNTLTFEKPGQYLVDYYVTGTGLASGTDPSWSGTVEDKAEVSLLVSSSGTQGLLSRTVNVIEAGQTLIADWSSAATTLTTMTARIASYLYSAS
jgi:hypothetical protein